MAGTASSGGMVTGGMGSPPVNDSAGDPSIPPLPDNCPTLTPGTEGTITVLGQQVDIYVGNPQPDKQGPVFFYFHGTGSTSGEVRGFLRDPLAEIQAEGGIVASFTTSTGMGTTTTGNNVWNTGDFAMTDIILACAIDQLNVDPRRVYAGGCSAGGLNASAMVFERSSYLAGAMPNSGGQLAMHASNDPSHTPAVITAHGAMGDDVVIIDFATVSDRLCTRVAAEGGVAVDCDHGGGHCAVPAEMVNAQWEFLKAHPYGVTPEPYVSGLPAHFPASCKVY